MATVLQICPQWCNTVSDHRVFGITVELHAWFLSDALQETAFKQTCNYNKRAGPQYGYILYVRAYADTITANIV